MTLSCRITLLSGLPFADTPSSFDLAAADHLGEHGEWEKKSNFDLVVRVPLMIHVPWKPQSQGQKTEALVELIDVFPTIAGLVGLPPPQGVDGMDLSQIFDNPPAFRAAKNASYHQYPACQVSSFNQTRAACNNVAKQDFDAMVQLICFLFFLLAVGC